MVIICSEPLYSLLKFDMRRFVGVSVVNSFHIVDSIKIVSKIVELYNESSSRIGMGRIY